MTAQPGRISSNLLRLAAKVSFFPALNRTIHLRAFAKINLGLKILFKRPDGYHEIRTIFQTISLHDHLRLTLGPDSQISVECADLSVPTDQHNLIYRACEMWKAERGWKGGVRAKLEKAIPAGSGLGGGSSDAAATLLGLERLTGDRLNFSARYRLASALGSDVPAFLFGGRVLGCGRGEEVYPLVDIPRKHCLVIRPPFPISTAEAYQEAGRKLTSSDSGFKLNAFGVWSQFPLNDWGPAENDFEEVVFAKWPELGEVKDQFIRAGAETASLTGSGSAIYAIFDSARQLTQARKSVPPEWSIFKAQTLPRRQYQRLIFDL
jgi:4-diphosphocytidyl-2-C-methyl-D-erythritol kinase